MLTILQYTGTKFVNGSLADQYVPKGNEESGVGISLDASTGNLIASSFVDTYNGILYPFTTTYELFSETVDDREFNLPKNVHCTDVFGLSGLDDNARRSLSFMFGM